jgi:multiple antibiotic resistance protein
MTMELIAGNFWLCFVPLFVAVDALGTMPIFTALVGNADQKRVRRVVQTSVITALSVAVPFIFFGEGVLRLLGITVADFMIAGGIILFLLSVRDLLSTEKTPITGDPEGFGPVPIGVPLIVGPAVLTTVMLLVSQYGVIMTAAATIINVMLGGLIFGLSGLIMRVIGTTGAKIASKIANLLLAAIAVMLVRKGILVIVTKGFSGA